MAENKKESFTVTDRRLFRTDGESRAETSKDEPSEPVAAPEPAKQESQTAEQMPPPPSAAEQHEQAEAYRKSSKDLDNRVELSGHSAKDLEMTFERFLASLYMTAMLQLGLMHQQGGQPQIDVIG